MNTELGIFVGLGILIIVEIISFRNKRKRDTISEVTWRAVYRQPVIAFLAGLLMGHLFWQSQTCRELLEKEEIEMPGPAKGLLFGKPVIEIPATVLPIFFGDWSHFVELRYPDGKTAYDCRAPETVGVVESKSEPQRPVRRLITLDKEDE